LRWLHFPMRGIWFRNVCDGDDDDDDADDDVNDIDDDNDDDSFCPATSNTTGRVSLYSILHNLILHRQE